MKLLRITMSDREGLVNVDTKKLSLIGNGSISCGSWNARIVKMRTPTGVERIDACKLIWQTGRQNFLEYVDGFLKDRGLYLTNANYSPRSGLSSHRLTGILHRG